MKRLLSLLPVLLLAFTFGCLGSDDDDDITAPVNDLTEVEADSVAGHWFGAMTEELEDIEDPAEIENLDMDVHRAAFQAVLDDYPNHGLANLGMAAVLTVELGTDQTIWNAIDSLFAEVNPDRAARANSIIGQPLAQQFRLITEAPLLMTSMNRNFPITLTAPTLQRYIHNVVLDKVDGILDHIQAAANNTDFSYQFTLGEETAEVDLGEIYLLEALVLGLRSGLRMTLPYDLDIAHPTLGYDWLFELDEDVEFIYNVVDGPPLLGDSLFTEEYERATAELLVLEMLNHQLQPGSDFLSLRTTADGAPYDGAAMLSGAYADLLSMLTALEDAVTFILAEQDNQNDDVISIEMLELLNADIAECTDCPEEWEDIQSVIDWAELLLTEPIVIPLDLGTRAPTSITIDLVAFFEGGVSDWKTMLPYHQWRPHNEWILGDPNTNEYEPWNGMVSIQNPVTDEWLNFDNIAYHNEYTYEEIMEQPIDFLDGPNGDVIDIIEVMPYLPDYEFGGIFPGMTRSDWESLLGYE